jgi:S1-C subfamily serine protease
MPAMRSWLALALLTLSPAVAAARDVSVQEALLRAKPAVAMVVVEVASEVTLRCGARVVTTTPSPFRETGTGWFIGADGWMITNAHVVSPAHAPSAAVRAEQARKAAAAACGEVTPEAVASAQVKLEPSLTVILSNGIRLPATVAKYSAPVAGEAMSGRDLALLRLEASDMPTLTLADSSEARIGDRLHILGFPGVVLSHELLNASAKVEASVTNGAISSFKMDIANQPVIQTDAPAAWGNSGGPAVDSRGDVVGVLTFVSLGAGDRGEFVQGFNFVIPSAAVKEFLADTGVTMGQPSRFNAAWHAGLAAYFDGRHDRAASLFAEANRLLPELPDVRRLTADNAELVKNPPARPFPWALVAVGLTLVSIGGYGAMWAARARRNRFRIAAAEVARMLETSAPPLIVDARSGAAYARSPVKIPQAVHVSPAELQSGVSAVAIDPDRTVVAYCT